MCRNFGSDEVAFGHESQATLSPVKARKRSPSWLGQAFATQGWTERPVHGDSGTYSTGC